MRSELSDTMASKTIAVLTAATIMGLFTAVPRSEAKPELSKKEKTACVTCHVKNGAKELNDKGKHYKEKGALPK